MKFARVVPLVMIASIAPERADACGGLFCSNFSPTPIDQSAERILFEVLDDGTVSATVEIRYQGEPSDFSWIVPVGGTPLFVEVGTKEELNLLDTATRPTIIPPQASCFNGFGGGGGGGGFGCTDDALSGERAPPTALNDAGEGEGEVNVTEYPSVGPYDDIVVVDGTSPQVLIDWLNEHNYRVTEGMRPFIEQYTLEGYSFLATKLQPNADTLNMAPIRFHCPQPYPEIPLRLTAIAAEPEMGFLVFVAANERYMPANYAPVVIEPKDVRVVAFSSTSNYAPLVSKRIDEEGGLGFVTERAQPALAIRNALDNTFTGIPGEDEARAYLETVLARRTYVTRFYGRMSANEMIEDPEFIPQEGAPGDVDGTIDLSDRTLDCEDPDIGTTPPCGTSYCGENDACGVGKLESGELRDGCICRGSHLARATTGPNGLLTVMCTSPDIDLHGGGDATCAGVDCGNGTCIGVNDRPTCNCDEGNVAVLEDGARAPRCVALQGAIHEPTAITWKEHVLVTGDQAATDDDDTNDDTSGCTNSVPRGNRAGGLLSLALLFAVALAPRVWRAAAR